MRAFCLLLLSALLSTFAGHSARAQECPLPVGPALDSSLAEVLEGVAEDGRVYMGCRPSAGECVNSCPDRRGQAETDPARCDPDYEGVACYCLVDAPPEPQGPPPDHSFMGCRPSFGECLNSCPSRQGYAEADPAVCDPDSPYEGLACYCAD